MDPMHEYLQNALENAIDKMVYYEKKENQIVMNYYAGKVDTLRELINFLK
nr:MAG TPA: hypothetical protein [Caudoviricetes sp.]